MHRPSVSSLLPLLVVTACSAAGDGGDDLDPSSWQPDTKADNGQDCQAPSPASSEWNHSITVHLTTAQGDPHHGAVDTVVNPGEDALVEGRFAYGPVLKDLEDEQVSAFIATGDCEWTALGEATTDDDGTARFSIPAELLTEAGRHDMRLVVNGDGSDVYTSVWVVEAGTQVAIFDIDGTLTTSDGELFQNILFGAEMEMYPQADDVAWTLAAKGYLPVYVTGRPLYLDGRSRSWLAANGFPRGPLKMVRDSADALPLESFVGAFKQRTFEALRDRQGLDIAFAYGNATTDICAYAGAGVDPERTFIIGKHAGEACEGSAPTQAVDSYPQHLPELDSLLGQ